MEKNLCVTCLSRDRSLVSLYKIRHFLEEIKFLKLKTYNGDICWECGSVILKCYKFKIKALKAQEALYSHIKIEKLKPLTNLETKLNVCYDHQYHYDDDLLTNCDTEPKVEKNTIKDEIKEKIDCKKDTTADINEKQTELISDIEHVYISPTCDTEIEEANKRKHISMDKFFNTINKITDKQDIETKYIKVVFSEEEMIKNREDKRNHHNFKKLPYQCDSCVLGFKKKRTYEMHLVKKHDEFIGHLVCDVCKVRFPREIALDRHRRKHYVCYKCRLCNYVTTEQFSAINHCKIKHKRDQLNSIQCKQCNIVVRSPGELEQHTQTCHTLYCDDCGVRFKGKDTLRRHRSRIHATKREFICDICLRTFVKKSRLESHMVTHNTNIAKKMSYCHVCKVQYKNIYVYRSHLKNSANHSDETYSCPVCGKNFVSKVYWNQHYKFYHLHNSKYECKLCDKIFISDWRLKSHKQIHHSLSRSRDHHCNVCGKNFFTISSLRNHKLTHSDQRNFMCENCGDTFKQRPALYTHAKLVHAVRRKK